jgi:murein L,D-transpeptidase YafK
MNFKKNNLIYPVALLLLFSFRSNTVRFSQKSGRSDDPVGKVYLIIDKSDYELQVYDEEGWYATYPVVFGSKDQGDKMMEGDRKTPEGKFKINSKRKHEKWHKMLSIDYPNKESWEKFTKRKKQGLIPQSAKIGNGIAIHGTWPNDELSVDDFTNWTNGCISLKNEDLDEIEPFLPIGTEVLIRR